MGCDIDNPGVDDVVKFGNIACVEINYLRIEIDLKDVVNFIEGDK